MLYIKLTGATIIQMAVILKHQEDALDAAATCLARLGSPDGLADASPADLRLLSLLARSLDLVNERRKELELTIHSLADEFPVVNTWTH